MAVGYERHAELRNRGLIFVISSVNSMKIKVLSIVAAFMVVQIHTSYGVGNVELLDRIYRVFILEGLYGFAVPFFFIVSGFFFMKRYDGSWRWWMNAVKKRIQSLIAPYFLWVILFIVLTRFLVGNFDIRILSDFGIATVTPANGSMWYVKVLFFMCVLAPVFIPFLKFLKRHQIYAIISYAVGALMLGVQLPGFKTYWRAAFYFTLGIGIYFGVFNYVISILHRISRWRMGLFLLWGAILCLRFSSLQACKTFWLYIPLLTVPAIWVASAFVKGLIQFQISPGFVEVCGLSFFVYCSHEIFIRLIYRFMHLSGLQLGAVSGALLTGTIVFVLCCSVGIFLKRLVPKLFIPLTGGRG